jgi:UDP-glucose 4-epimerase
VTGDGLLPPCVLVTGGAGFIGANLCRALAEAGAEHVVALDDLSTGRRENLQGTEAELVEGTILDAALVGDLVQDADAVVHLAALPSVARSLEDPAATHEANATGTLRVLQAAVAGGLPPVVVASSSSVYGANRIFPAGEDLPTQPLSPYAASKLAAESYGVAFGRSFGLPVLAFRFFNVFGPLQRADHAYAAVVPAFVSAAMAGSPLTIHGDGGQTRDFTFVGSVTTVLLDALRRRVASPGPVNLAFGGRTSVLELADTLARVMGRSLELRHVDPRTGDVRDSQADTSRLRALFPDLHPVPLDQGLRRTVQWFTESGAAPPSAALAG